jgi:hypothetical protein
VCDDYDADNECDDSSDLGCANCKPPVSLKYTEFSLKQFAKKMVQANYSAINQWKKGWVAELLVVLATVPDRHFGSGSGSEPNRCQIGGPGCQHTRTVDSGTVRCKSPNPSGLGGLSAGRTAGPSVDLYNVLVFAVA